MDLAATLTATPSLLNSNLTASEKYFAYISNAAPSPKVVLVEKKNLTEASGPTLTDCRYKDEIAIQHVNFMELGSTWFLVFGLENSLQVWNEAGALLLAHINRDDLRLAPAAQVMFYASTKLGENVIAAGSSAGSLHFLKLRSEASQVFDKEEASQPQHSSCITAMTSYGSVVITGDGMGAIGFWNKLDRWTATITPPVGVPATTCVKLDKLVCFGFAFGQIRIYNVLTQKLLFEIGAHARGVMALATHPSNPYLISVGEDCCLNVWNLQPESVGLVSTKLIPNSILVGVCVFKSGAVVASYDRQKLYVLPDLIR